MVFSGRGTCHMSFKVGDTVVYPHHGAARIEAVESRTIKGEEKTYLVLKVDKGDLTVRVLRTMRSSLVCGTWSAPRAWSACSKCYALRTQRSPPTGRVGIRPTWRS